MILPEYDAILPAPFGALGVHIAEGRLRRLEFLPPDTPSHIGESPLIREAAAQLAAYFNNPAHRFELPLEPIGSDFRRRVWQALLDIPAGHPTTYGDLARRLGSSARAVGQALGDNPLPIVIPCHRVVAANGSLGGFNHSHTGYSLEIKRWLLAHEGAW
jgi:methylated-DNA-[protein]-cysteine S-methyltransferase